MPPGLMPLAVVRVVRHVLVVLIPPRQRNHLVHLVRLDIVRLRVILPRRLTLVRRVTPVQLLVPVRPRKLLAPPVNIQPPVVLVVRIVPAVLILPRRPNHLVHLVRPDTVRRQAVRLRRLTLVRPVILARPGPV